MSQKDSLILVTVLTLPLPPSAWVVLHTLEADSLEVRGISVPQPTCWDQDNFFFTYHPPETANRDRLQVGQRDVEYFISKVGSTGVAFQYLPPQHVALWAARYLCQGLLPIAAANVFFPQMIPLYSSQHLGNTLYHTHVN